MLHFRPNIGDSVFHCSLPTMPKVTDTAIREKSPSLMELITGRTSSPVKYLLRQLFEGWQIEGECYDDEIDMVHHSPDIHNVQEGDGHRHANEGITAMVEHHSQSGGVACFARLFAVAVVKDLMSRLGR